MKKQIIVPVLLVTLSLFWYGIILGHDLQQKKIPKPKPLQNLTSGSQDTTAQKQQKERLELPDVWIIGKATAIRIPIGKVVSSDLAAIRLKKPEFKREGSIPSNYASPEQTPKFQPSEKNHATSLDVRFGNYNSTFMSVAHWQQMEKVKINFDSNYDRSDGQHPNSQFE